MRPQMIETRAETITRLAEENENLRAAADDLRALPALCHQLASRFYRRGGHYDQPFEEDQGRVCRNCGHGCAHEYADRDLLA